MKRYRVSVNNGEYGNNGEYVESAKAELPLVVRECIESLIDSGSDCGTVDIPGYCCQFSVCPEQYFPEDMVDDMHRICAELRTMAKTIDGIDSVQFQQTITTLRYSASGLTAAAIRECKRNNELTESQNDRIELAKDTIRKGQKLRDKLNERELDRLNDELCEYHSAE